MKIFHSSIYNVVNQWKIIVVIVLLFHASSGIVFAQELTPSPSPKPVEYALPYPGLLPGHPFYFLKAIRDTVQDLMTSHPLKKAEFYLLQADKRMRAGEILLQDKKEEGLAGTTVLEGLQYYEKALAAVADAKKQGLDIHEITQKLVQANEKHRQLIKQLQEASKAKDKEQFKKAAEKAQQLQQKAKTFLPAKSS